MIGMLANKELLRIAIEATIEAGKAIMAVYDAPFDVEFKDDKSPLTEADKRSNAIINEHLLKTGIPIISEENKQIEFSDRKDWDYCWVVDPVDGTKEFVKRNGEFTVNIALIKNGKPQMGVIGVPAENTLYWGDVPSKTAFKIELENHKESQLDGVERENSVETLRVVGSRSHMNDETKNFIEKLQKDGNATEIVSRGSSLKFCLMAEGKADVYPRFAPTMEWDTAAGQAICEAVGINVISLETNKPLQYNKENLLNPWFLVKS